MDNEPTHIAQACPELVDRMVEKRKIASEFFFRGDIPRVGEAIRRGDQTFIVDHVLWDAGKVGALGIKPYARIFLK